MFTAIYALAQTLSATADVERLMWNGVVGALLSLALAVALVPLAGPVLYETALNVLTSVARPPVELRGTGLYPKSGVVGVKHRLHHCANTLHLENQEANCQEGNKSPPILKSC